MALNRELRRLTRALLLTFVIVALAAAYWASIERDRLLAREDNPRLLAARASIQRGAIFDRRDTLLARTVPHVADVGNAAPRLIREYLLPEFNGALGYFSLTYGTGGIENAHDRPLAGADRPRTIEQILFDAPIIGSDVRLTLDAQIQAALYESLGDRTGAGIVISVPSGDVLAQLSNPTYDPNTLDADWAALLTTRDNPFFNRAVQGRYQPGGLVQTPLLALIERSGISSSTLIDAAAAPIRLDTLLLTCTVPAPQSSMTLLEAYLFGCPAPFERLAQTVQTPLVLRALQQLNASGNAAELSLSPSQDEPTLLRDLLLGQGEQVVSPLDIALYTAAIVNEGNAPQPRTLLATRPPDTGIWQAAPQSLPSLPVMTAETAARLEQILSQVEAARGPQAPYANIVFGSHTALAYSGESTLVWYMSFARTASREGIAVAIVLEDTRDPYEIRAIGLTVMNSALAALSALSSVP